MAATPTSPGTGIGAAGQDFGALSAEESIVPPGIGPYRLAWRRLRRNHVALAFGFLFLLIVVMCLLAPVYSADIAHIAPNDESHIGTALSLTGIPVGPTWHSQFFLGAGVQVPNPSWGTMISDGTSLIPAAIHLTLVPGIMLVLCVLGINVFGDGVRDALDPRAQVRIAFVEDRGSVVDAAGGGGLDVIAEEAR